MRVLVWAAAAVVACAGAAAAQAAQMAAGGAAVERDTRELLSGRELAACSTFKCKKKCVKAAGCAWVAKKCGPSVGPG